MVDNHIQYAGTSSGNGSCAPSWRVTPARRHQIRGKPLFPDLETDYFTHEHVVVFAQRLEIRMCFVELEHVHGSGVGVRQERGCDSAKAVHYSP